MLIIGEKINTVRKSVARALERRDGRFFQQEALNQVGAGAGVIDLNAGSDPHREQANMRWLVEVVQEVISVPLCIDSPNPEVIKAAFEACRDPHKLWANSITAQSERVEGILPLVKDHGCRVVGLCMDEDGVPNTVEDRLRVAQTLVKHVDRYGIPRENLYLDPLVEPIAVMPQRVQLVLRLIREIRAGWEDVRTVICLSAVSFGLPDRRLINRTFLVTLMEAGIDAVILDPLDCQLMSTLTAAEALFGQDENCLAYIAACRNRTLVEKEKRI